jgi:acetylornithine deacetylase/succinyl-diaminopimelate desuccinylase-like protein
MSEVPLPKIALIGEPTNFKIYTAHKGYASLKIYVKGKGGHSSTPMKGLNAISIMAGFKNGILPQIIGDITNLQMLPWKENRTKATTCYSIIP